MRTANDLGEPASEARSGTQSIERAVTLLRVLAERDRFGWNLVDLAARCGLTRSTTHRLLAALVRERLVQQRPRDRRYVLGPLVYELGLGLTAEADFVGACKASILRLARRFDTMALLYLRSGHDLVCADVAGPSPYASGVGVGTRMPLAAAAGGIAMLIAFEPDDKRAAIADNMQRLARLGPAKLLRLQKLIERSERLGQTFNQGEFTRGVNSFALSIRDEGGHIVAALVVSGLAEQFPARRATEVFDALREEIRSIGVRYRP